MRSILIRLKKLKTCKRICGILLSCILGPLLFLSFGLEAFADYEWDSWSGIYGTDYTESSFQFVDSATIVEGNNSLDKIYRWDTDLHYQITLSSNIPSYIYSSGFGYIFEHFFSDYLTISISNLPSGISSYNVEYLGYKIDSSIPGSGYVTYNNANQNNLNPRFFFSYIGNNTFIARDFRIIFTLDFRIHYFSSSGISLNNSNLDGVVTITPNRGNRTFHGYRYVPDNVSLGEINEKIGLLTSDYSDLLDAVNNTNDMIANDYSGISSNINDEVSGANVVESAADQAISSALPYADNEINDILQYDYTSIGTDSLTALSFWKSLGDYILSNSNLVGIGALLVACLFLGFVIYLLRL